MVYQLYLQTDQALHLGLVECLRRSIRGEKQASNLNMSAKLFDCVFSFVLLRFVAKDLGFSRFEVLVSVLQAVVTR